MAAARSPLVRRPRSQAGFGLVEILFSTAILVIAVMGNVSSITSAHGNSKAVSERGRALEVLARFVERVRGDDDWAGLYARLRVLSSEGARDTSLTSHAVDATLRTYPATTYFADFNVPTDLGVLSFLVQVPAARFGVGSSLALRESQSAPRYGLPADLNGDGVIGTQARDSDYRALPVVIRMRWTRAGAGSEELIVPTWLRGER